MTEYRTVRFQLRFAKKDEFEKTNRVLLQGEPAQESDTGDFKLGDGVHRYTDLPYFTDKDKIIALINETVEVAVADITFDAGGVTREQLVEHVESLTPHPVYDDGPSFYLLYQNAKV